MEEIGMAAIENVINMLLNDKDSNDISITLLDGYYLRRTPYRIELRHKNSTIWLAYVMYRDRDISPKEMARILRKKQLELIGSPIGYL